MLGIFGRGGCGCSQNRGCQPGASCQEEKKKVFEIAERTLERQRCTLEFETPFRQVGPTRRFCVGEAEFNANGFGGDGMPQG